MSKMEFTPEKKIVSFLFSFLSILFFAGCAEIGPPPGGPVDKTKPRIINSEPVNGSVQVPSGNTVTLYFSERINPPANAKSIYISPHQSREPKIKWKSDKVVVTFPDSFATNQTYIISLGSGIQDLRRNPLDSGSIIAFSTGEELSNGKISGYIEKNEDIDLSQMLVGLYDTDIDSLPYVDSVYPDYIAAVKDDGFFSFQYLPEKEFQMVAFNERVKDERYNPAKEYFAVPDRKVFVDSIALRLYNLTINASDSSHPRIQSAVYTSNKLLTLRFSKNIDLTKIRSNIDQVTVTNTENSTLSYRCQYMMESELERHDSFSGYFGDIPAGLYSIQIGGIERMEPILFDSLLITVREDKIAPSVRHISPDSLPLFLSDVALTVQFSEPIDTTRIGKETFVIRDKDSLIVPLTPVFRNPSFVSFPTKDLSAGNKYTLLVSEFDIYDLKNNVFGDSTKEYIINVLNPDSIGTVTGKIEIEMEDKVNSPIVLTFQNIKNKKEYTLSLFNHIFSINLPSGRYSLHGYLDENDNSIRDLGSVIPYRFSESAAIYPDTIAVRARFETAEINLTFK